VNKKRLQNVSCAVSHAARERFSTGIKTRIATIALKQCYTDNPSFSHPERYENLHPIPTAGSHCNHTSVQQTLKRKQIFSLFRILEHTLSVWPWVYKLRQRSLFEFCHQLISVHKMLINQ
uniref:Uncharacterized protein n=1 Tax=Sinocyclocheilus anshuiensis TaxID=1608454 RepID=A0A671QXG2_9TELE